MRDLSRIAFTEAEDADDPSENYPPRGTPETALIFTLDSTYFDVVWHTGRYFHGQCECAGYRGEEIGIGNVPDRPGIWMFENGHAWGSEDDCGVDGDWRKATPEDFWQRGMECPLDLDKKS